LGGAGNEIFLATTFLLLGGRGKNTTAMALDNDAQQLASYLENILVQLQDPNNDVRSDAEKKFEQTKQHASACLKALVVLPHSSQVCMPFVRFPQAIS